jgi:hypothetical protein
MSIHATDDKKELINVIEVDPDKLKHEFEVELGGTIELKLKPHDFDHFEIIFERPWPPTAREHLTGSIGRPIRVPMPHEKDTFKGHIYFKKKDGTRKSDGVPFLAKSCPLCGGG